MTIPYRRLHAFACLLLPLLLLACASSRQPREPAPLRVMTFNVRLLTDADGSNRWALRRDLAATIVREQAPDLIGTQELFKQQGDDLVAALPGYAWFGRSRERDGGGEHMGVFYRKTALRVIESGDFWLSDTPEVPGSVTWNHPHPRMVTWALFERTGDGKRFYFFNTHLPYREQDSAARLRGARLLLLRIAQLPTDIPVVVTGDFNTAPDSAVHRALTATLHDAWEQSSMRRGPEGTFHGFTGKPEGRIDWILLRGIQARAIRTIDANADGRYPSDHFPVIAELAYPHR